LTLLPGAAYKQRDFLGFLMTNFALARRNMVEGQLRPNKVTNADLLAAIGELARERFLPEGMRAVAYADDDVPLGNGRFLIEPMVLARLIQALHPGPGDRAMVVASGRGYGTAVLARLVKSVTAVESDAGLAGAAKQTIESLGLSNVTMRVGKMEDGIAADAPYDLVLIEGAVRQVPQTIIDQMADGGRLATVLAADSGLLGAAHLIVKDGDIASGRPLFDAGTPPLPGFAPAAHFAF
jgi:protein-L-isoaspartate(D-aspartate) O-methyltransferase